MSMKIDMCDIDELKHKVEKFLNDNPVNNIRRIETVNPEYHNENTKAKINSPTKKLNSNLIYLTGTSKNNTKQYTPPSTKCVTLDLNEKDLKILLQNFYKLEGDEQQILISHLKKLETNNPELVNKLKEFARVTPPAPQSNLNDTNELEILDELNDILQDTDNIKESDNNVIKVEKAQEELKTEEITCELKTKEQTEIITEKQTETIIEKEVSKEETQSELKSNDEITKIESMQEETVKEVETQNNSQGKKAKIETTAPVTTNKKKAKKIKKKLYKVPRKPIYNWGPAAYRQDLGYDYRDYREWYRYDTFNMPAYYYARNYNRFPHHYY